MPRMLVLCPYPEGVAAGQRLKYEPHIETWRRGGWEVDVAPFMDPALWRAAFEPGRHLGKAAGVLRGHLRRLGDMARLGRYDLAYVFMYVTPFGTTLAERLVRARVPRLIYDIEDNILDPADTPEARHPNPLARLLRNRGKARFLLRRADRVITASPLLAERYAPLTRTGRCAAIPASVDTDRLCPAGGRDPDRPVTLGWTGTFSTRPYLDRLAPVLQRVARQRRLRLRVIGNFDYALDGVEVESIRWSVAREVEDLQAIDIGLYPLTEDRWTIGKSGIKAIQYMAVGRPTVASDVGTTPAVLRDGATGLLVRDAAGWESALLRLIDDADLRDRMGRAARADAVARFSHGAVARAYREVIDAAMR